MITASLLLESGTCTGHDFGVDIKQTQSAISIIRSRLRYTYIYIYLNLVCKYNFSYYLNQIRGHQEETHNLSHIFRCLFPDLYLIYMTITSIFKCYMQVKRFPIVYAYVCLYINVYIYIQIQMFTNAYMYNLHGFPRHYCLRVSRYAYKHGRTSNADPNKLVNIYICKYIYIYMSMYLCVCHK